MMIRAADSVEIESAKPLTSRSNNRCPGSRSAPPPGRPARPRRRSRAAAAPGENSMATKQIDPSKDYYGILGLKYGATNEEIKKTYKELALKSVFEFQPSGNSARLLILFYTVQASSRQKQR
jgi:hypothetical protein